MPIALRQVVTRVICDARDMSMTVFYLNEGESWNFYRGRSLDLIRQAVSVHRASPHPYSATYHSTPHNIPQDGRFMSILIDRIIQQY